MRENRGWILREQSDTKNLTEDSRYKLVQSLLELNKVLFKTETITKAQKVMTATAALEIFPQFRSQNDENGGVVCVHYKIFWLSNFIQISFSFPFYVLRIFCLVT